MKKLIAGLLTGAMILSMGTTAFAKGNIYVDLVEAKGASPQIVNDRTMVPMRKIFESMGAEVLWEDSTQTIRAFKSGITVVMQINNNEMTVDGSKIVLDVPPQLSKSRTVVPVRAIAESFGCTVNWNGETNTVIITT